jgi:L-rhamnose isomerase
MTIAEIRQEVLRLGQIVTECHQAREALRTAPQYSHSVLIARNNFSEAQSNYRAFLASDLVKTAIENSK